MSDPDALNISSSVPNPINLQSYKIPSLPPNFYYIPNFISPSEESSILSKIPAQRWITLSHRRLQAHPSTLTQNNTLLAAPLPAYLVNPIAERFKMLGVFEGTKHGEPNHVLINEYKAGEGIMPHEDGAAYAEVVATVSLGASLCLEVGWKEKEKAGETNTEEEAEIRKENDHIDIEIETGTLSFSPQYKLPTRILQEPRSLLVTTGSAYTSLLHGISPLEVDENLNQETVANWELLGDSIAVEESGGRNFRGTRVSLTYRDVLKVSKGAGKVLGGLGFGR